jgi:hypothetical protein
VCWILLSVSRSTEALGGGVNITRPEEQYMTNVASSSTTTLQSFTSARARLSRDLSPTLRFAPSLSMTLSRSRRVVLVEDSSCSLVMPLLLVDFVVGLLESTRRDRCSASHNSASSCWENGSKLDRMVPGNPLEFQRVRNKQY